MVQWPGWHITNFHSFTFICSSELCLANSSFALSLNSLRRILPAALGSSLSARHLVVSVKSVPLRNSVNDDDTWGDIGQS